MCPSLMPAPPHKPVIAVGHSGLDYVYRIAAFPASPTKIEALDHLVSGGGMAANAAATVARLGGTVALWSRIGGDWVGRHVRAELEDAGVDVACVRPFPEKRTPTACVIVDATGERLIVSENDHALPVDADWLPLSKIPAAGVVVSDLTWLEGTIAAFRAARAAGVATLLDIDLGSVAFIDEVIGLTDFAIFSAPAFRRVAEGAADADYLSRLVQGGVRHAGVTRGAKGYLWMTAAGAAQSQRAFAVEALDTTGAGDAFHGAFAWALSLGCRDEAECARIAAAAASLQCLGLGARSALPTRADLDAFLEAHDGRAASVGP